MIKVCHMTSAHKPTDIRIFEKECVSLAKKEEYDVYLVAKGESYQSKNVNIVGIGEINRGRISRMLFTAKDIYKKALEVDADIYHFHDPELLPYGLKLKKKGKKVIFDSHENYSEQIKEKYYIPKILRGFISKVFKSYESKVTKKIDAVIFPCPMFGKHPFEGRSKRCIYINNTPILEELYDKYNEKDKDYSKPVVCYAGGLNVNRGITKLIEGSYKAGAKLILGGNFVPASYGEELKQKEEYKCVDFRGYLNRDEVLNMYEESTIGANVLLNIGQYSVLSNLSTKIYEFMSMGLPVISNDYPYAREVMEEYKFGMVVDSSNSDEIAKAITYLSNNPDIAKQMGENGRKAIKEHFNWSVDEKVLYDLYLDILE